MNNLDILGLGVSTVDLLSLVDHLPSGEEVLQARKMDLQGGGPVATALVAASRLGATCGMLDSIGDDWRGRLILEEFQREGVAVDGIRVHPGCTSSSAMILVKHPQGERSIIYHPGNAPELVFDEIQLQELTRARYLHLNGRHWPACLHAARVAHQAGVKVSFDGGAYRYRPELNDLLPWVDICIVAWQFAQSFSGEKTIEAAAALLLKAGPSLVVITDGVRGSTIFEKNQKSFHQPAFKLEYVVDTTGCGDSYHGAFLYALSQNKPLEQCAAIASAVGALNTRSLGGRAALPDLDTVTTFITKS